MEHLKPEQFVILGNPGVTSTQILSPHNSQSSRVTITRVVVAPGAIQPRHSHSASEQIWYAQSGSGMLLLADGKRGHFAQARSCGLPRTRYTGSRIRESRRLNIFQSPRRRSISTTRMRSRALKPSVKANAQAGLRARGVVPTKQRGTCSVETSRPKLRDLHRWLRRRTEPGSRTPARREGPRTDGIVLPHAHVAARCTATMTGRPEPITELPSKGLLVSVRGFLGAICSDLSAGHGRMTAGRAGGATSRRITHRSSS